MTRALAFAVLCIGLVASRTHAATETAVAPLFPFVLPWDDATPGITDLSGWLQPPAGRDGFIHAGPNGHLYAGANRIRFFGVNLCFGANFPRPDDADKIAVRLAKFGVNIVRFHHMDAQPFPNGIRARDGKSTRVLDPEALERLDHLIATLKRHGIYANLNLLVSRPFNATDGLPPEIESVFPKDRATIGFFYAPLLRLQQEYARKLLTHRNVETGLPYAQEPAVAFVEINNENGLAHSWLGGQMDNLPEVFARELQRQWNAWLRTRYRSTEKLRVAWGMVEPAPRGRIENGSLPVFTKAHSDECAAKAQRDWMRFLSETEGRYWQSMARFLKNDLHVHAVIMGTIVGCSTPDLMAKFDAVDTHAYWQHPQFPARQWDNENWFVPNLTMVNERGGTLPTLALHRVLGKPLSVTEYNHPAPNTYSSEAFLLLGAYAALQDWDAIYAFAWSHRRDDWDTERLTSFFDIDQHPAKLVTLPAAMAMFRRGDVAAAREQIVAALDPSVVPDLLRKSHPWSLISAQQLGVPREAVLLHRVAIDITGSAAARSHVSDTVTTNRFVSDTGELIWDVTEKGRGVVTINTAKSKAVIGFGEGKRFDLGGFVIEPGATRQGGWSAITATEVQPNRWLITATGYVENTDMQWKTPEHTGVGRNWGKAPSLVEGIPARITLTVPARQVEAWTLNERGQQKVQLPVESNADGQAVLVFAPQYKTLWYEITAKQD